MKSNVSPSSSRLSLAARFLCMLALTPLIAFADPLSVLSASNPDYPAELKAQGIEGESVVKVTVGVDGLVVAAEVVSTTHEAFGVAAVEAVQNWRFRPATKEGEAIVSKVKIPVQFKLSAEEHFNIAVGREMFVDPASITERVHNWGSLTGKLDSKGKQVERWRAPLQWIQPKYPEKLKGSGIKAEFDVEFIISPDGYPLNPVLPEDLEHPEFGLPALITLSKMRFKELIVDGKSVYSKQNYKFKFSE